MVKAALLTHFGSGASIWATQKPPQKRGAIASRQRREPKADARHAPGGGNGGILGTVGTPSCIRCQGAAEAAYRCRAGVRSELWSSAPSLTVVNGALAGKLHNGVPQFGQKARPASSPLSPLQK